MSPLRLCLSALAALLPASIAGMNIAAGAASAAVLARHPFAAAQRALRHPLFLTMSVYALWSLISGQLGVDPKHSLAFLPKDLHKVWIVFLLLIALEEEAAPAAYRWLAAGFALIALWGSWQSLSSPAIGAGQFRFWTRAHAFVHPVTYAEQLVFGLLGAACFWKRERKGAAVLAPLLLAALVLSQTRAAFIALAAGLAALFAADRDSRRRLLPGLALVLAAALCLELLPTGGRSFRELAAQLRSWRTRTSEPQRHLNDQLARLVLWKVAAGMFRDRPLAGVGPGNYFTEFPKYYSGIVDAQPRWGSAHNLYLHELAERGAIGGLVLGAVLAVMTIGAWRRARRRPNPWTLWSWSAMAAFLVMNLTEVAFQNEQVTTLVLFVWCWGQANEGA